MFGILRNNTRGYPYQIMTWYKITQWLKFLLYFWMFQCDFILKLLTLMSCNIKLREIY